MTMQDFDYMDGIAKTEVLSLIGIFLGTRRDGCFRISLYQVEHFYVELFYHLGQGCYVSLRSFDDVGSLNPYLEDVDISEIVNAVR